MSTVYVTVDTCVIEPRSVLDKCLRNPVFPFLQKQLYKVLVFFCLFGLIVVVVPRDHRGYGVFVSQCFRPIRSFFRLLSVRERGEGGGIGGGGG